jgi:hypothetical protein
MTGASQSFCGELALRPRCYGTFVIDEKDQD